MGYYDLKALNLIAQGGEADIYDVGGDKILRVPRKINEKLLEKDKILYSILERHQINVPKIYEYTLINGKPAVVMQRIFGCTMLDTLKKYPLDSVRIMKRLAHMQASISEIEVSAPFNTIQDIMNYFAAKPALMEKSLIDFTIEIFDGLPKGNQLCHGDFHPGNILMQDGVDYIIDWSAAYRSNYLSDVAHSFLLMKHVPKIPGENSFQHKILNISGKVIANAYIKEVHRLKHFDYALFSKWTVVMSFLRAYYGLPSERAERIKYIQTCWELNAKKVNAAKWYAKV